MSDHSWEKLAKYYKLSEDHARPDDWLALLESVALKRGFTVKTEDDVDRAARKLIRDFQNGRFGRLTLEYAGKAQITSPLFKQQDDETPDN